MRHLVPIPAAVWKKRISDVGMKIEGKVGFMEDDHRKVHHFVVRELPKVGGPMRPGFISENLDIPVERVSALLDELEKRKAFLVKNSAGEVLWAYPVTAEKTPHHLTFNTGENIYAA